MPLADLGEPPRPAATAVCFNTNWHHLCSCQSCKAPNQDCRLLSPSASSHKYPRPKYPRPRKAGQNKGDEKKSSNLMSRHPALSESGVRQRGLLPLFSQSLKGANPFPLFHHHVFQGLSTSDINLITGENSKGLQRELCSNRNLDPKNQMVLNSVLNNNNKKSLQGKRTWG